MKCDDGLHDHNTFIQKQIAMLPNTVHACIDRPIPVGIQENNQDYGSRQLLQHVN